MITATLEGQDPSAALQDDLDLFVLLFEQAADRGDLEGAFDEVQRLVHHAGALLGAAGVLAAGLASTLHAVTGVPGTEWIERVASMIDSHR